MGIPSYTRNGGAGFHFHFFGGNPGGAIALEMLLDIPIIWGAVLTTLFVSIMLFTNSYKKIERSIIAFVSVIGLSFIYELFLVDIDWPAATVGWVTPAFPKGSMLIIMSVLGAVVMPHNCSCIRK